MLDVECCVDVDAGGYQFLDIHVALGMPAARGIAVRQLIDQGKLRAACQHCVEVHFGERTPAVFDLAARHDLEAFEQRLGLAAAMRLDNADNDIRALAVARLCGGEHLVGLAHARRGPEEQLQATARALLRGLQQRVGGGPSVA